MHRCEQIKEYKEQETDADIRYDRCLKISAYSTKIDNSNQY